MGGIAATFEMYARVFGRAGQLIFRNWPVLGSVLVYGLITTAAMILGANLGLVGGLLANLVWAACVGSFLSLIETMIRSGRLSWTDFGRSFGVYLWDVVGVTFIVWVVFAIVAPAVRTLPQGPGILIAMNLLLFVLFNAVPELIYLGHHSSLEVLTESFAFISDNWIEWFPPTIVAVFLLFTILGLPLDGPLAWLKTAALASIICVTMVARGLLFIELRGSSRRGRAFQRAAR
jgi:hypothetical protein